MKYPIDYEDFSDKIEFYEEVVKLHRQAEIYLLSFNWCNQIKNSSLYTNIGYVLCIFLFEIDNAASRNDDFLWVIVGDFPSMYLDTHGPNTTTDVLKDYIRLAVDWITNVKEGISIDDCYPFDAQPNIEMAELFHHKINSLKNILLDHIEEIKWLH